jgi:prevent-host-death family protein
MAMARRRSSRRGEVAAAEFKARCLELVDQVKESRVEYIVTRHGRPVARLGPVEPVRRISRLDSMQGTLLKYDRPFDPIDATWSVDRDDDQQS